MSVRRMVLLCFLLLATIANRAPVTGAGSVFSAPEEERVVQFIQHILQCRRMTGISVAVVKGNASWTRGFGEADIQSGRTVDNSTLFAIGSVTKAFTATILGLYVSEDGRYKWESPISELLGHGFGFVDSERTKRLTLKDVLTHRTGLLTTNLPLFAHAPHPLSKTKFAERIRFLPETHELRDLFDYNNWMYSLAGRLSEVMGGATWEELLTTRLFRPLNMTSAHVIGYDVMPNASNFAQPYIITGNDRIETDPSIYDISPHQAAGAIAASADDMAKWLQFLINKGRAPDGAVLVPEQRMREILEPYMLVSYRFTGANLLKPEFPVTYLTYGYGYAWMAAVYKGYQVRWHSGGFYAYVTLLAFLPDLDLGVYVSTSGNGGSNSSILAHQIFHFVTDILLGQEPWLTLNNSCRFPAFWKNATQPPTNGSTGDVEMVDRESEIQDPHRYSGTYGHRLFGDFLVLDKGEEGLHGSYNNLRGRLFPDRNDQDALTLMEVEGPMAFMFRGENSTRYVRLNFTEPETRVGKFRKLLVSSPDIGEMDVLVYERGIKFSDPLPPAQSGEATRNVPYRSLWIVLVFSLVLTLDRNFS